MSLFHTLSDVAETLGRVSSEGMALTPLALGDSVMAGVLRCGDQPVGMHRQPDHEELLLVIEGEATFRVGDETQLVRPGDLIFVPRDTEHGSVNTHKAPLSLLSIITPRIDLAKDVVWNEAPPAVRVVA